MSIFKISDGDRTHPVTIAVDALGGVGIEAHWTKKGETGPAYAIFQPDDAIKLGHAIIAAALKIKGEQT